jgi:tetratricopeptide (TPR) repeat protein
VRKQPPWLPLLLALHAIAAFAQSRPDAPLRERALPDNVIIQRDGDNTAIVGRREWASPVPGPRRAPATAPTEPLPQTLAPPLVPPQSGRKLSPTVLRPRADDKAVVDGGAPAATPSPLAQAWEAFERGDDGAAAALFEQAALAEGSDAASARQGLALLALRRNDLAAAERLALSMPADHAQRAPLLRDIAVAQAQAHYAAGRHEAAEAALAAAASEAPLPRHARALEAWNALAMHDDPRAAERFATLYADTPDAEAADGVLLSFTRAGREAELAELARTEPFGARYRSWMAERAFAEKRFNAARALSPERYGEYGSAGTVSVGLTLGRREKSATGLSEMALEWGPSLEARWAGGDGDEWSLQAENLRVSSPGALGRNRPAVTGVRPQLAWRSDREERWEAALGATPSGGPVLPEWEGRIARSWRLGGTDLRLTAYRQSNKESMLAYVGMRDAAGGRPWGRVLMQGVAGAWHGAFADRWSASLQARHEDIGGERVAANRRDAFDVSVGYDLKPEGFDHAVISLNAVDDRFARNLSHFTPGHGGYFSPQTYTRIGPAFDFMTAERQTYLLKGRAAVGNTGQQEAAAPVLPLADNGLRYTATSSRGRSWEVDVGGSWQVSPQLQLGGWLSYRKSLDYEDRAAMLTLRLLLEPRRGVLSTDLPVINRLFQ